jgi:glycogen synthase
MTVLEAMACGLPVVSTETAGTVETVQDGRTGWLVPQLPAERVPAAIADRTLRVLSDPDHRFGIRARERCLAHFSSDVALGRFTAVYDDLLNHPLRTDGLRPDQPVGEGLPGQRPVGRGRLAPPGVREGQNAQP